jgi:hypothetical protein
VKYKEEVEVEEQEVDGVLYLLDILLLVLDLVYFNTMEL